MNRYNGDTLIFRWHMALNPNTFVDGVMNGFSLHIEPPSYLILTPQVFTVVLSGLYIT